MIDAFLIVPLSDAKSIGPVPGEADRVAENLRPSVRRFRAVLRGRHGAGEIDEGVRAAGARVRFIFGDAAKSTRTWIA